MPIMVFDVVYLVWQSLCPTLCACYDPGRRCCCLNLCRERFLCLGVRTKIKTRLETAYGEWVERIPAWISWATQVCSKQLIQYLVTHSTCPAVFHAILHMMITPGTAGQPIT